jgi:hypothetical protein
MDTHDRQCQALLSGMRRTRWEDPTYTTVRVTVAKDGWINMSAQVDGQWMKWGWNSIQRRWSFSGEPPVALLEQVRADGWIEFPAHTGSAVKVRAPKAETAKATAPDSKPIAKTVAASPAPAPAPAPKFKPLEIPKKLATRDYPEPSYEPVTIDMIVPGDLIVDGDGIYEVSEVDVNDTHHPVKKEKLAHSYVFDRERALSLERKVIGSIRMIPANFFTYAKLFGKYNYNTRERRGALGGYIVRYVLDKCGVSFNRGARVLGTSGTGYLDITGDPSVVFVPPEALEGGVEPQLRDILVTNTGSGLDVHIWSKMPGKTGETDIGLDVDMKDITAPQMRTWGRRLMQQVFADNASTVQFKQVRIPALKEILPDLSNARILYRDGGNGTWFDISEGSAPADMPVQIEDKKEAKKKALKKRPTPPGKGEWYLYSKIMDRIGAHARGADFTRAVKSYAAHFGLAVKKSGDSASVDDDADIASINALFPNKYGRNRKENYVSVIYPGISWYDDNDYGMRTNEDALPLDLAVHFGVAILKATGRTEDYDVLLKEVSRKLS